jgi:hypothetical protein
MRDKPEGEKDMKRLMTTHSAKYDRVIEAHSLLISSTDRRKYLLSDRRLNCFYYIPF